MTETRKTAVVSPCGLYRYYLTRRWGLDTDPTLLFVMLNPSTADAEKDDPTIRKCIGFAERLGMTAIAVVNCYAYRTPKPAELYAAMRRGVNILGPENDAYTIAAMESAGRVVAAWGANKVFGRARVVDRIATIHGKRLEAVAITPGSGAPQHPLMARYVDALVPFEVQP